MENHQLYWNSTRYDGKFTNKPISKRNIANNLTQKKTKRTENDQRTAFE